MAALVHPGFSEVELGFFVFLVAGEFLADAVAGVVGQICAAIGSVDGDVFAEGFEVSSRNDLAKRIGYHPRASELVGCRVTGRGIWRRLGRRVLRDKLTV